MREFVGLASNSIIRCGTLVSCQGHGMEFKKPWHLSLALKYNRNAPCTKHNALPCWMFSFPFLP